jgi:hypothetical protein
MTLWETWVVSRSFWTKHTNSGDTFNWFADVAVVVVVVVVVVEW